MHGRIIEIGVLFFIYLLVVHLYCVKAQYSRVPADDLGLDHWLKEQPGVVPHTVQISRERDMLHVVFIMVRNLRGQPSFPDLSQACDSLGYTGLLSEWTDDWDNQGH
jgi:hypothetical protein